MSKVYVKKTTQRIWEKSKIEKEEGGAEITRRKKQRKDLRGPNWKGGRNWA